LRRVVRRAGRDVKYFRHPSIVPRRGEDSEVSPKRRCVRWRIRSLFSTLVRRRLC
jgi:hypothetical protein